MTTRKRCAPPEGTAEGTWHWIGYRDTDPMIARWEADYWAWSGVSGTDTPEQLADDYIYLGPVLPFSGLLPHEAELLAVAAEEAGEALQAIGKVLRHGYESRHPDGGPTNREALERELGDVLGAIVLLGRSGAINTAKVVLLSADKVKRLRRWLHQVTIGPGPTE